MRYVIRSMSTTDFEPYSHEPVRPYHIYLMRPELRGRAYWSDLGDAQRFDSYRKAEARSVVCSPRTTAAPRTSSPRTIAPIRPTGRSAT